MPLRVLLIEDSQEDALLVLRELRRSGFEPTSKRVETAPAMREALGDQPWDLILSDFVLPNFGGLEALVIAHQSAPDLPFILISNKVSEETLVDAMRAGAADFVMKDRLSRLGLAVQRELADAATRHRLTQAQIEWRTVFDAVQDAIFIHDADFCIVRANLAYAQLAQMPVAELIGRHYWEVFPKRAGPLPQCLSRREQQGVTTELIMLENDREFASRSFHIYSAPGAYTYSVHVLQDMTERNRADRVLKLSEARYRSFIELTGQYAWHTAADGMVVDDIPLWRSLTGQTPQQVKGHGWCDVVHPDDYQRVALAWQDAVASQGRYEQVYRVRRHDGIYRDLLVRGVPVTDAAGGVREWVGTAIDITERTREQRRTAALLNLAVSTSDVDEKFILQQGVNTLLHLTDSQLGFLHFVSEDQNELELVTWSTDQPELYRQASSAMPPDPAGGVSWTDSIRLKQPLMINDCASASRQQGLSPASPNWQRMVSVPVIDEQRVRMVVGVGNAPTDYVKDDLETIQLFAMDLYRIVKRQRAELQTKAHIKQLEATFMDTVKMATTLNELRDPYTIGHERRVADMAATIGAAMGFEPRRQEGLRVAGLLHDVGKISIPAEILAKPGKLTPLEFQLIKEHARAGYTVLKEVNFPWPVAEVALQHHERLNGSGYPQGLIGEAIMLEARILAVADVVEAMASHRPYRPGLGIDRALAEIEHGRGTEFDALVVDTCLQLFREQGYAFPG